MWKVVLSWNRIPKAKFLEVDVWILLGISIIREKYREIEAENYQKYQKPA